MSDTRLRTHIIGVIVLSLFGALLARLWYLQVASAESFAAEAQSNRIRTVQEESPRGRVLDRQGKVLIDNRVANAIVVDRSVLEEDRDVVIGRLAELVGKDEKEIKETIDDPRISPFTAVPVAIDVPIEVVTYLEEHREDFPGVSAEPLAVRRYPQGNFAAHVLGYVGEISDDELHDLKKEGYVLGETLGKAGIEQTFEEDLRGRPRIEQVEVDSKGNALRTVEAAPGKAGNDVMVTLDVEIQKVAEESLTLGIEAARRTQDTSVEEKRQTFKAPGGAAVVIDPRDGSVIAMASYPTFNPEEFTQGIPSDTWEYLNNPDNAYPLTNRALQGVYPAASTFKLFSAIAGLEAGLINENTTINDTGSLKVADRVFTNSGRVAYGTVNLRRALTVSSDVFFYNIGAELWKRDNKGDKSGTQIQKVTRRYGFDQKTGINLPAEAKGRIPDAAWKKQVNAERPDAFPFATWLPGDNVNLAIGQGDLLVTPLQLANAYAAFANGGMLYEPRVADSVVDADGDVVREIKPKKIRDTELEASAQAPLLAGLTGVVNDTSGTASGAFAGFPLDRVSVAGKTGTAQVAGKESMSWFVALTPAQNTEYVVVVGVEEAGFGASVAAPIARRIVEGIAGLPLSTITYTNPPAGN